MPFIVDKNNFKQSLEHRIWLPANYKCLVLKKDKSVSFAGDGGEDGTLQKGASKSQLFIFVVFSPVTYLTANCVAQEHIIITQPGFETSASYQDLTL